MPWVRLDDGFDDDPDIDVVGESGISVFVCALSWCSRNRTDGIISLERLKKFPGYSRRTLALLLHTNWLVKDGFDYCVRNFLKFNFSSDQIDASRAASSDRKRAQRERESRQHLSNGHSEMSQRDIPRDSMRD